MASLIAFFVAWVMAAMAVGIVRWRLSSHSSWHAVVTPLAVAGILKAGWFVEAELPGRTRFRVPPGFFISHFHLPLSPSLRRFSASSALGDVVMPSPTSDRPDREPAAADACDR
jgi:hypothetical protein